MKHKYLIYCAGVLLMIFAVSCGPKVRRMDTVFSDNIDVDKPIKNYKVTFYHTGTDRFPAGIQCSVAVALRNMAEQSLVVKEWYAKPEENVILEYQPWYDHLNDPEPDKWQTIVTPPADKSKHYQLVLEPKNVAIIDISLPFVKTMRPGPERRFFCRARLSLKSMKAETPVFAITVF